MGLLRDWGFSSSSWQGKRGEYWVLAQALLLLGFGVLPVYRLPDFSLPKPPLLYGIWGMAAIVGLGASILLIKGLLDLGGNLTPLPHPRDDGQLVQSGIYGVVRHPLYGGLILAAIAWAIYQLSLSHAIAALVFLVFFDAKASREEVWLCAKFSDYQDYQQRVNKLIPWVY